MNTHDRRWIADGPHACKRGEMVLARVALVAVERPRRVVLGVGAHQAVAADLGEDAGGSHDEAAGVGLDHPLDATDVRRDEVPAAVDDRRIGHDGELGDRPAGGEALGGGHAELVTLHLRGVTDAPGCTPLADTVEKALAVHLREHLRIADAVESTVGWQHGGPDRQRAGPGAATDLVDPDDDRVAELPQLLLDAPRRGDLLGDRSARPATKRHEHRLRSSAGNAE